MGADMYTNRHKYFRWTPRTAWITLAYVVLVPSMVGYIGYVTDVSIGVPIKYDERNSMLLAR